jgi:thiosulfate/3-mercaptopyruvate sulfurtransferase
VRASVAVRSLLLLCLVASPLVAQRDAILVSPTWLASHLKDANLVLLHVGDREEYERAHIPGARFVNIDAISVSDHSGKGLMLEMPAAEKLREGLASLGISDNSRIIVYFAKDWVTPATRVMFTLDYAGLGGRSSLLDGGMNAWTRGGNQTASDETASRIGTLSALKVNPIVVDAEFVRSHVGKPGYSVVDGRAASFYDGVQTGSSHDFKHKTGHVAGAKSFPFTEIADDQLLLKSSEQLAGLFAKAGVVRGDTVIGYCHIGQQATGMLFAARSLGFQVRLYDGSFEDWSHRDLPVETTKKP